jgi:hypothetical protein
MKINRNNYEIWFLDYYEGRLSQERVTELMAFLKLHYDLKEEFDNFENISLSPAKHIVFDAKDSLKKQPIISVGDINEKNYEEFFIGAMEGDLVKEQSEQLATFLVKNPHLKKEFELFGKTKIVLDKAIIFDAKQSLKKNVVTLVGSIDEKNYEEYFIGEMEGDLSKEQSEQLATFLKKNPSLKKEHDLFGKTKIAPDATIIFGAKQSLKRNVITPVGSIDEKNYAGYFIAAMKSELELSKLSDLKEFLNKNPQLHKEYSLFGQTKLSIDTAIAFNRKQEPKKEEPVRIINLKRLYYPVSIAASVLLLVGFYFLFNKTEVNKVYTADRNDIHLSRTVHNINYPVKIEQSGIQNTYANNLNKATHNVVKEKVLESIDFQYASLIKPDAIPEAYMPTQIEPEDVDTYNATLAALQKRAERKNKTETTKEDKTLSLKEFAMLSAKKSLTPKDKRNKVTPKDKLTMWDLAYAGINKFDKLTGSKASIEHKDNNNYTFALGNNIEFSRSSNK